MLNYNAGTTGSPSTIDTAAGKAQLNTFFWLKKAIIQSQKEQYFLPLSSTVGMPKNYGKTIKVFEYVPLLDDRNVFAQGIAADGVTVVNGNLYGSSRDIGTITGKLPTLTENGGRVNRVGFTRLQREGTISKFGFFYEFTKESIDFDSDDGMMEHLSRELMTGAVQLTEAVLQKDLLASASTIVYSGTAVSNATMSGETATAATDSVVDYKALMRLDQILTDNRTPKQTKVISGSRMTDTRTIPAARVMFVGSEIVPLLKGLKDLFNNAAFIPVQHYADAGTVLNGEIGSVDAFRIVQVPEMLHWEGALGGAAATGANRGYRTSGGKYNVYPMLVVGDESFTTIGFQTDGKSVKFSVITKMPGTETADRNDPYGEKGFSSIKWYYGVLIKRSERIGLLKTLAPI